MKSALLRGFFEIVFCSAALNLLLVVLAFVDLRWTINRFFPKPRGFLLTVQATAELFVDGDAELLNEEALEVLEAVAVVVDAALHAVPSDEHDSVLLAAALETAVLLHDQQLFLSGQCAKLRERICSTCEAWLERL